jgi:hypothetical protein
MAKRHRLTGDFSPDYTVLGISSQARGYKLAMLVNEKLGFRFHRIEDFTTHDKPGQAFVLYEDQARESQRMYYLLYNFHLEGLLVPSLKGIDAFMIIYESFTSAETTITLSSLRKGKGIQAAFEIEVPPIKGFDILLDDLEVHLMNVKKKKEDKA